MSIRDLTTDERFNITVDDAEVTEDAPFAPVGKYKALADALPVDGWETNGPTHQTEADCEDYEYVAGEWVHTGTESVDVDIHSIIWQGDHSFPGAPESEHTLVTIEFVADAIIENPPGNYYKAPAYTVGIDAFDAKKKPVASKNVADYENLAEAIHVTTEFLSGLADPELLVQAEPAGDLPINTLLDAVGLPPVDE